MSFEMDFLVLAADLFNLFVLQLLPLTIIILFMIYVKRIVTIVMEKSKLQSRSRVRSMRK